MTSKTQNMREESKKYRSFRMCLNLNGYQIKMRTYSLNLTYMDPTVITSQKSTINSQKRERNEHKETTKENH